MGNDHQVVAYGYEDGNPNSKLFIYDNNSPGQETVLEWNTAYDPGNRDIRMGGRTWRGFFMEAYAPQVPSFLQAVSPRQGCVTESAAGWTRLQPSTTGRVTIKVRLFPSHDEGCPR